MMVANPNYEATAKNYVERWDAGDSVWSIEMGGIGPGYEQTIQIAVVELMRACDFNVPSEEPNDWLNKKLHQVNREQDLGMSGGQAGVAMSLAYHYMTRGPRAVLEEAKAGDRKDDLILVSKNWPGKPSAQPERDSYAATPVRGPEPEDA